MLKVFITGASSGIGWALAEYYAAQGAQLGLSARRAEPLLRLSARWPSQVRCYPLDVTDAAALRAAGEDFIAALGVPDTWQMGLVTKVLRLLPNALYDRLFAAAPRKPRQAPSP